MITLLILGIVCIITHANFYHEEDSSMFKEVGTVLIILSAVIAIFKHSDKIIHFFINY